MPDSCIFCEIADHRAPAEYVAETPDTTAFRPINPVTPGHVLIVPNVHVADAAVDRGVTARTMADAARYASAMRRPFNLITSAGPEATQTVFHLHVHYVPRREGDGLHLPWTGQSHEPQIDWRDAYERTVGPAARYDYLRAQLQEALGLDELSDDDQLVGHIRQIQGTA